MCYYLNVQFQGQRVKLLVLVVTRRVYRVNAVEFEQLRLTAKSFEIVLLPENNEFC
jgi:hypothetical protein